MTKNSCRHMPGECLPCQRRYEQRQFNNEFKVKIIPSHARSRVIASHWARRCSTGERDLGEFWPVLSFKHLNAAFNCSGLSVGEKLVLVALSNHANQKGFCFPSYSTLARECCMNRRSVMRIVRKLEDFKLIKRKKRYPSNGYQVLVTLCHHLVTQTTQVVTLCASPGDPMSPKPSGTTTITKNFANMTAEQWQAFCDKHKEAAGLI